MTAFQFERVNRFEDHDESHGRTPLQNAIVEAFDFLNAGARHEAIVRIKQYQDLASKSDAGCYIFGLIYFNAGILRRALVWFDRALELRPAFSDALSARAIVLQRLGQPEDALQSFEELLKLQPNDPEAQFNMGVVLQSIGRMADALRAYENVLHSNPAHCEALTNRGALLERFDRLEEALVCFQTIERIRPGQSANLFNKGSVLQKLGRHGDALAAYEEAARCGLPDAETELNRGNVLQKLGRLEEALAAYDLSSRYRCGYPQALYNKGIALQGLGRTHEALLAYDTALGLDPCHYEASCNRGNVLYELGHLEEALAAFTNTLKIRPGFLPALTNRANILLQLGRAEDALLSCSEILRQVPEHAQGLGMRGAALHKLGRSKDALNCLDEAIRLDPAASDAWLNRGNVLQELDRVPEAILSYEKALRIKPQYPEALSGLGVALKEAGRVDEALLYFNEALNSKPDFPDARNNRAGALLLKGNLEAGFEDFESRWGRSNAPPKALVANLPKWTGQDLAGHSIIVWDEQGLGDLIQFSRYVLCLVKAGADVTLLCRRSMHRLLSTLPVPIRLVDALDAQEQFAFQSALMSLPYGFKTGLGTIPAPVPYLHPEPGLVTKWADRIGDQGFRIGIGLHGNRYINLQRSIPLQSFAPLAALDGVRLISLMKDQASIEVKDQDSRFIIEGLGEHFDSGTDSFVDCAAVMENVDLVVTSDTAIAHLAGALGKPVLLALKHVADWRWLMDRNDCPWYPTMKLFRQARKGDWKSVFDQIRDEVQVLIAKKEYALKEKASVGVLSIPGAVGELIDKLTILEIKETYVNDEAKLAHIRFELTLLRELREKGAYTGERLVALEAELKAANRALWNIEEALREHEVRGDFGTAFVSLARQVYLTNDKRAFVKKRINELFGSAIVEEKSYSDLKTSCQVFN